MDRVGELSKLMKMKPWAVTCVWILKRECCPGSNLGRFMYSGALWRLPVGRYDLSITLEVVEVKEG